MSDVQVRAARPEDHTRIIAVCDAWWGRPVAHILPRLFLDHDGPGVDRMVFERRL